MNNDLSVDLGFDDGDGEDKDLESKVETILEKKKIRHLGRGGYATVFELEEDNQDRSAIKILTSSIPKHKTRFEEEIRCLTEIEELRKSKNIIDIKDHGKIPDGEYQGNSYYMMPVCDTNLKKVIEEKNLDEKKVLDLMLQICDGIYDANSSMVLHRDIKPENILIFYEQNSKTKNNTKIQRAVLADFGIGKALELDDSSDSAVLTLEGEIIGTPMYMSPAQASGKGMIDMTVDVYAAGAILCEMTTGHPPVYAKPNTVTSKNPFSSKFYKQIKESFFPNQKKVIKEYFSRTPDEIRDDVKDIKRDITYTPREIKTPQIKISKRLESIILKACAKDISQRYVSIDEMQEDLKAYKDEINGKKIKHEYKAKKVSLKEKLKRFWKRHPLFYTTSMATIASIAIGFGAYNEIQTNRLEKIKAQQRLEAERNSPQNLAFKAYDLELKDFKREKEFQSYEEKKKNHQQLLEKILENSEKFPKDERFKELFVNQRESYKQFLRNTNLQKELENLKEDIIKLRQQEDYSQVLFKQKLSEFGKLLSYQKLARFLPIYTSKDKIEKSPIPKNNTFMPEEARGDIKFGDIKDLSILYSHAKDLVWAYHLTKDEDFLKYAEEVASIYTPELIRDFDEKSIHHCLEASETVSELYKITGKKKYLKTLITSTDALLERKTESGILHTFDFPRLDTTSKETLKESKKAREEKLKGEREKMAIGYSRFAGVSLLANKSFLETYKLTGDSKYKKASEDLTKLFFQQQKSRQKPFIDPITGMVPYHIFIKKQGKIFVMNDVFCNSIYNKLKRLFDLQPQSALLESFVSLYEYNNEKPIEKNAKNLAQRIISATPNDYVNHVMIYPITNSPLKTFNDKDFKAPGIQLEIINQIQKLTNISNLRYERTSNITDKMNEYANKSFLEILNNYVRTDTSPFTLTPNCSVTIDRFHVKDKGGDMYEKHRKIVDILDSENIFKTIHILTKDNELSSYMIRPKISDKIILDGIKDESYSKNSITDFFSSNMYPDPSDTKMYSATDNDFYYFFLESKINTEIKEDIKEADKLFKTKTRDSKLKFAGHNIVLANQKNPDEFYVFGSNTHHLYDAKRFDTDFDSNFKAKTILEDNILKTEFKIPKKDYNSMSAFTVLPMQGAYYLAMQGLPNNCYLMSVRENEQLELKLPLLRLNNETN